MNTQRSQSPLERSLIGCLLGTAVGDAIGLPGEGLSKKRLNKLLPPPERHRFLFGHGMVSDDTEHACMTAQALVVSAGEPGPFVRRLSREMRLWLLGIPAGSGLATLRSVLRLCVGFSPDRSGVFSAGNGPAMRAAIIGVAHGDDPDKLQALIRVSTRMTHTDPKAEYGALAVAIAAHAASRCSPSEEHPKEYLDLLRRKLPNDAEPLVELVARAVVSAESGASTEQFSEETGQNRGVSGYIYSTVPIALHAWFGNPGDFRAAISAVTRCGGDTDTTAAIVGGIVGAGVGKEGIPADWLSGLAEWPKTTIWMEILAARLAEAISTGTAPELPGYSRLASLPRNTLFTLAVLAHGFRRLLPPY